MSAIFSPSAALLFALALFAATPVRAFEPLGGPAWPNKALVVRNTCFPAQSLSANPMQRFVVRRNRAGGWTISAHTGPTPAALLNTTIRTEKVDDSYRVINERNEVLSLDGANLRWVTSRSQSCAHRFRFDQFPMAAPARRVLIVGRDSYLPDPKALRFETFDAAINAVRPGDLVLLSRGLHHGPLRVPAHRSGAPGAWIVIAAIEPYATHIEANTEAAALGIDGARYVEVRGLSVTNRGIGDCIGVRASAHVRIIATATRDCGGGGIAMMQSDHMRIEGNLVLRTSFMSPWQNSGISIYQAQSRDAALGGHAVIANNVSAFNDNRAPAPGQRYATDGNGIIIDDGRNTQNNSRVGRYPHAVLVENNLTLGNGGSGIRVFASDNVTIRRNTSFHNDQTNSPRQQERSELSAIDCGLCRFERNVAVSASGERAATAFLHGDASGARWKDNVLAATGGARALLRMGEANPRPDMRQNMLTLVPRFARATLDLDADLTIIGPSELLQAEVGADLALTPPMGIQQ
jgi:hypothetical protein